MPRHLAASLGLYKNLAYSSVTSSYTARWLHATLGESAVYDTLAGAANVSSLPGHTSGMMHKSVPGARVALRVCGFSSSRRASDSPKRSARRLRVSPRCKGGRRRRQGPPPVQMCGLHICRINTMLSRWLQGSVAGCADLDDVGGPEREQLVRRHPAWIPDVRVGPPKLDPVCPPPVRRNLQQGLALCRAVSAPHHLERHAPHILREKSREPNKESQRSCACTPRTTSNIMHSQTCNAHGCHNVRERKANIRRGGGNPNDNAP